MIRQLLPLIVMLLSTAPQRAAAQKGEPPWRSHIIPWESHAGQPHPWREDPRLKGRAEPDYDDDFQVLFLNPDSASGGRNETMWVRVIAYDRKSDLFLGILLNQPYFLRSVQEGDNVVFRIDAKTKYPFAIGAPNYGATGWPNLVSGSFGTVLRDGIRAYRWGNNGHNMPGIERCISILSPAMRIVARSVSREEQFIGHYVLGRCLAEKYETKRAIEEFRSAIALDPNDADAHMSLLAELSVMVHQRPGTFPASEDARWEREFLDELAIVKSRFASHDGVQMVFDMIFDPEQEAQLQPEWKPHVEKLRRIGYAIFRWRQR